MVGVPGRSKACHACRRRRKGCDYKRPACMMCQRVGIPCPGYEQKSIFINSSAQAATTTSSRSPEGPDRLPFIQARYRVPGAPLAIDPCESMNGSVLEQKYVGLFWELYLPSGQVYSIDAAQYSTARWTVLVHAMFQNNSALRAALGAITFTSLGHLHGEHWMMNKGAKLYGEALRQLFIALQKPRADKGNSLIATARLLSLYEIFFGIDKDHPAAQYKAWLGHNSGEASIFLLREPEAYISGDAHTLLADGRLHLTISSIIRRKKCFLNDHGWKTVPWRKKQKTYKDKLIDIMLDIPELLEDIDNIEASSNTFTTPKASQTLAKKVLSIGRKLYQWYMHTGLPLRDRQLGGGDVGISVAHVMATYWTAQLVLNGILQLELFSQDVKLSALDSAQIRSRIIQLLSRLMSTESGWFGRHIAAFPAGAALSSIRPMPPAIGPEDEEAALRVFYQTSKSNPASDFMNAMQARRQRSLDAALPTIRKSGAVW